MKIKIENININVTSGAVMTISLGITMLAVIYFIGEKI